MNHILRPRPLKLASALLAFLISTTSFAADRPNIIVMMADDMGYSDIGCYGGEIETPALDQLASKGLRFTQFYNTGRCCPTRASLLSGLYPHQAGVGWMMSDSGHDGYRGELNRRCVTIAEALKENGYATYMSGKWHVTKHVRPDGPKDNWPRQRGFDRFFGTIHGAGSFFDPNSLTRDNTQIVPDDGFYYTDAISDNAVTYIREHDRTRPFFMYVAYTAPHWPMHALPDDIRKYKGKYAAGWDAMRAARYERMIEMGLIDQKWKMTPRDSGVPAWEDAKDKPWFESRMEVYAAMVDRLDQGIGRIVNALKTQKQFENTLILFLADNGGCAEEYGSKGPVRPDLQQAAKIKPMAEGELQTAMQPKITRDGKPVRTGYGVVPGPADTYIAYGKPWANASNTPFRLYKHWNHEGGISTPLIAHWPQGIARHGQLESQPGHLVDLMATCMDVSKSKYPGKYNDIEIQPMEGRSLQPAFEGKKIQRDALYWEHEGNRAVRVGDWKLVANGAKGKWELYDLKEDRTELNDLAEKNPQITKELQAKWEAYAERAQVYPLIPYYSKKTTVFSRKKRFNLKQGDNLSQNAAPMIAGKAFQIDMTVKPAGKDGVIVAQGGTAHGYSLYLKDAKLMFAMRHNGTLTIVESREAIPLDKETAINLALGSNGEVVMGASGADVAFAVKGKVPGLLKEMPIDGLQVGEDLGGEVGKYSAPYSLDGEISGVLKINN